MALACWARESANSGVPSELELGQFRPCIVPWRRILVLVIFIWIYLFDFSLCESLLLCSSVLEPNFNLKIRVKTGRLHSNSTCVSVRESSLENSARSGIVRYCFSANLDSSRSSCSLENGVRGFRSRLCLLKFEMRVGLFSSDFGGDLAGGEAEPSDESKWRCKDLDQFSIFFTKVWPDTNLFTLPWLYNVRSYRGRFTWWRASWEAIHRFFVFRGALSSDFLFDLLVELCLLHSSQLLLSFQLKLLQDQSLVRLLSLLLLVQQNCRMEKAERNAKRVWSYSVY